jgi:predicted O-methyltransferase YrrM
MNKFFFPLNDGYYYGRRLHGELKDKLGNKLVQNSHATGLLCQAIRNAGHGDYVEIGSLHGGSAITAALTKKEFKLNGYIRCIEPDPRDIYDNASLWGVENKILVYQTPSEEMVWGNYRFSCSFIDGDHRPPNPLLDWYMLRNKTTKYIIFDDYDKSEPGVVQAVTEAMGDWTEPWKIVHMSDAIVIFERSK